MRWRQGIYMQSLSCCFNRTLANVSQSLLLVTRQPSFSHTFKYPVLGILRIYTQTSPLLCLGVAPTSLASCINSQRCESFSQTSRPKSVRTKILRGVFSSIYDFNFSIFFHTAWPFPPVRFALHAWRGCSSSSESRPSKKKIFAFYDIFFSRKHLKPTRLCARIRPSLQWVGAPHCWLRQSRWRWWAHSFAML